VTQARGLPFNPQKAVYHYLELLPRLEAKSQEEHIEIEKEIRERQKRWTERASGGGSSKRTPRKPRK
jgi:hypothetical protein